MWRGKSIKKEKIKERGKSMKGKRELRKQEKINLDLILSYYIKKGEVVEFRRRPGRPSKRR